MAEAKITWVGGMQFVGEGGASKHGIVLDASAEGGGRGTGARPMELLLVALGGCTAMDVISILQKMRQKVTGLEINLSGEEATDWPRRYKTIHLEYVVRGRGLDPKAVARSIELSDSKYCSVSASLRPGVQITNSYRIVEEE